MIDYRAGNELDLETVRELYRASTLAERRPVDDTERFAAMLRHANLGSVSVWPISFLARSVYACQRW